MPVTFIIRNQQLETQADIPLQEALTLLGLSTETHMALRDGIMLDGADLVHEGDVVRLIPVLSGG